MAGQILRATKGTPLTAPEYDRNIRNEIGWATVSLLLASTETGFATNDILIAEGLRFKVVTSGEQVTTAGSVKLLPMPSTGGFYDVRQWGVIMGDSANQTAKLQAAIDYVAGTGGELRIPYGRIKHTGITITGLSSDGGILTTSGFVLSGVGHRSTLECTAAGRNLVIGRESDSVRVHDVLLRDFELAGGMGSTKTATCGIFTHHASRLHFHGLRIFNHNGNGIEFGDDSFGPHHIEGCLIRNNVGAGIHADGPTGAEGNALTVDGRTILIQNGGSGIVLGSGFSYHIAGCDIEGNGDAGIDLTPGRACMITGNYFESHPTNSKANIRIRTACRGISIIGNYFGIMENSGQLYGIYCDGSCEGLAIIANQFIGSGLLLGGTGVYLAGTNYTDVSILNNHTDGLEFRYTFAVTPTRFLFSGVGSEANGPQVNGLSVVGAAPKVDWYETDQVAGQDHYSIQMSAGALNFLNDAGTTVLQLRGQDNVFRSMVQFSLQDYTTVGRPSGYEAGSVVYDSTLGLPVYWNGSSWRKFDGTVA